MSSLFRHKSIRKKFSLVIISACFAVLVLVSLLFGGIEYSVFRQKAVEELETLAAIVGTQLRPPLLNGSLVTGQTGNQILSALETNTHIHAAYLFDRKNIPIAEYLNAGSISFVQKSVERDFSGQAPDHWQQVEEIQVKFGLNHLSLYSPIFFQDQRVGALYLLSDLVGFEQRLYGLLLAVLMAGGTAVGFAWILSGRLQRPISGPILTLAETMQKVSVSGAYHLRSKKYAEDEVGQLVDGFNDMLTQIEKRDLKIEEHQKYLEQIVKDRTAKLTTSINELEVARHQADSANQAKSIFLANMTHELRTPLVGVLGMNELLIESSLGPQQQSLAESVQRSGQDLLDLINDILDFSKIEGGHLKLDMVNFDLLTLVEEVVLQFAERAYNKGLELICEIDPDAAWEVEADPLRVKQIIMNLLGNAIKFTSQGHIGLSLTRRENNHFCFEVFDTGIGIDKKSQPSIFEAFSQVDDSTSRLFGGTGLGLSIVHDLVHMMNGSMQLESDPGQGSRFRVMLPLKAVKPNFIQLLDERRGRSVLLFEPYAPARESFRQRLVDLGFDVKSVSSAAEMIQVFESDSRNAHFYDLIIFPDGYIEGGKELVSQAENHCETVVCLRKQLRNSAQSLSVIEVSKPLLWSRLLLDDFSRNIETEQGVAAGLEKQVEPLSSSYHDESKGKILIVDDNASTRELISFSLMGSGWQSDNACNAAEALAAVANEKYQLILMDINMPGTDGIETARDMRLQGILTPIYALTAHGDANIFERCDLAGMQGILRKPFKQKELFSLLDEYDTSRDNSKGTSE